jgi:(2Fe-2S) ferredoxin
VSKREQYFFVCNNVRPDGSPRPSCGRSGALDVFAALKAELNRRGLSKSFARVCTSSCLDMCDYGPSVSVQPQNVFALHMNSERVAALVQAVLDGKLVDDAAGISTPDESPDKDR